MLLRIIINARLVLKEISLLLAYFQDNISGNNIFDFPYICIFDFIIQIYEWKFELGCSHAQMTVNQITHTLIHATFHCLLRSDFFST